MKPVIALVGRPNVGKSTLFNRLTRSRDALVADFPGLTRDRKYGEGRGASKPFIVIDTGGLEGGEEGIDFEMASQSLLAIEEADVVLLLVDGRAGLNPADQQIVEHLRKLGKPAFLIVNKVDGIDENVAVGDFYALGMADIFAITASQGRGVSDMIEAVLAGMLGEERVVVFDMPGTTRDSVYIPFERHGKRYTLIDTAGIRRRGKTTQTVEKFSVVKSLTAIQDANVVVLVVDARDGIVEQDLHLLGYVLDAGRALVIALNKWDGMDLEQKEKIKSDIRRRFSFVDFAAIHFISALHGTGVGDLYQSVEKAYESAKRKLSTNQLTRILQDAVLDHAPPMINGRRIKMKYAHAGGQNPPVIVIHGKQTDKLPDHYKRYLEKTFRHVLKLEGTPIRIEMRADANPYTEHEQGMTGQQIAQKRRIAKNRKATSSRDK